MIPLSKVIAELDPNADVTCSGNNIDNIIWHKGTPIAQDLRDITVGLDTEKKVKDKKFPTKP